MLGYTVLSHHVDVEDLVCILRNFRRMLLWRLLKRPFRQDFPLSGSLYRRSLLTLVCILVCLVYAIHDSIFIPAWQNNFLFKILGDFSQQRSLARAIDCLIIFLIFVKWSLSSQSHHLIGVLL